MDKSDFGLIYRRNDRAMELLEERLKKGAQKTALLYGAAHGFDLQDRLMEMGFVLKSEDWLTAWALELR